MKHIFNHAAKAKWNVFLLVALAMMVSSCDLLKAPVTTTNGNMRNYKYVYVIPTAGVTASSGVYTYSFGVYGGGTKTVNPAEIMSGYLMKMGYSVVPSVTPELADKTLIASYGYTGRREIGLFSYASGVIIQFRDAKTQDIVASCEAEGCGNDETDDILQAIHTALNSIFSYQK